MTQRTRGPNMHAGKTTLCFVLLVACAVAQILPECYSDQDCIGANKCGLSVCHNGTCVFTEILTDHCDDGLVCTRDTCNPTTTGCENTPIACQQDHSLPGIKICIEERGGCVSVIPQGAYESTTNLPWWVPLALLPGLALFCIMVTASLFVVGKVYLFWQHRTDTKKLEASAQDNDADDNDAQAPSTGGYHHQAPRVYKKISF